MEFPLDSVAEALDDAGLLVKRLGDLPARALGITDDSRAVEPGTVFVAVRGTDRDGHDYLPAAEAAGATAAIVERADRTGLPSLVVRDGRRAAAIAAAAAYGRPARDILLAGVTGTNGKTTTVNMLRHVFEADVGPSQSASIGTLGVLVGSEGRPLEGGGGLTTPGPVELQRVFHDLVEQGVSRVAMEVSSHALHQRRVEGVEFDAAVFTNLTRDHLDYHGSMDAYFKAKAQLIEHLRPHGTIVINGDDKAWQNLPTDRRRVTFSARVAAEVHARDIRFTPAGSEWTVVMGADQYAVTLPLLGDFNIINALGAAAAAYSLGIPSQRIAERLSNVPQIPGRLEVLHDSPTVLRDYAHTPDALERALEAVRPFVNGRLILVFGCGGDRDRGKRPAMGAIAEQKADVVILTSDNPRTEDPERILDDIQSGMRLRHERIEDRRRAIARALEIAHADDAVLLAGKGHETYQIRGTTRLPFDEKAIVAELTGE